MPWVSPEYERDEVDHAGHVLSTAIIDDDIDEERAERAFAVISNWRSSHSFPLNTFKLWLLNKADYVDAAIQ